MADDEDTGAPEVAQEEGRSDAEWESLVARNEQAVTAALNGCVRFVSSPPLFFKKLCTLFFSNRS